jgi:putative transposase
MTFMANTYTQINIHVVFAVKGRENILQERFTIRLFEYLSGILVNMNQYPLAVGGHRNHVHVFFELNPVSSLADILEKLKANSSKWINDNKFVMGHFEWQRGYGGFSYSKSQRDGVIKYIVEQKKHHEQRTFKDEYMKMLNDFDIRFENQYLFDFFE